MATETLTPRRVAALKTAKLQAEVWDALVPGMALRLGRGGSKSYIVRYRQNGAHRRMKIGTHPHLSLADAREKARKVLADAQGGEDPALERRTRRDKDASFGALATEVLKAKASTTRPKTQRERQRIVEVELLPAWKARPVASITRRDVVQLVDRIAERAPVMGNRVLTLIKVLFNEGLEIGFLTLEANPAHKLKPRRPESPRDRYLDRKEIKKVWQTLDNEAPLARVLFQLTMLTSQRIGSVAAMRWTDIDDADVWCIPATDFKGKRSHLVPLSPESLAVLEEMRPLTGAGECVFPGRADGGTGHINSTNKALQRIRKRSGLKPWTAHDFRTTFRTWATRAAKPDHPKDPAGLGVAGNVADAVLGHAEPGLGFSTYTAEQARYLLSEKRDALKRWGAFILAAVGGKEAPDVA